ncbi:MAG TPA: hypothetical protein VHW90_05090 [Stellaceae bacterium]|jgi:hypothetical protein|nr:hypothetical protein [Stellaceae bacterium]
MISKTVTSLAFAAACVVAVGTAPAHAQTSQLVTNGPQASGGDFGGWSARRNVIESHQYDRLLQSNRGFRQARMNKECGPINDPQLHQQCVASFGEDEPVGSSTAPRGTQGYGNSGY